MASALLEFGRNRKSFGIWWLRENFLLQPEIERLLSSLYPVTLLTSLDNPDSSDYVLFGTKNAIIMKVSVLLGFALASLGSDSRVSRQVVGLICDGWNVIFQELKLRPGRFDPWSWERYFVSEGQESINHWGGVISQKNCTSATRQLKANRTDNVCIM